MYNVVFDLVILILLILGMGYPGTILLQQFWSPWWLHFRYDLCGWLKSDTGHKVQLDSLQLRTWDVSNTAEMLSAWQITKDFHQSSYFISQLFVMKQA
jgi:hypothetical protein